MSLLLNFGLPYELPQFVAFGPAGELLAIRYEMSNATLTRANYEPIFGAYGVSELVDVRPPVALVAICCAPPVTPPPLRPVPEAATTWPFAFAVLFTFTVRFFVRGWLE